MVIKSEQLLKEYALAEPVMPYISIVGAIFACKMVYKLTQLISSVHFKSYPSLSRVQCTEWNNRAMSTVHAVFITVMSLYVVFWSDLYSDDRLAGPVTLRSSPMSTFVLGDDGVKSVELESILGSALWCNMNIGIELLQKHLEYLE